ncbi:hypothetical protein AU488_08785 [Lonsdalea populi]|uniref:Uncharacterized protein n=1 Tax=Lonsdalea populi TaxID=1172565 RepID=A0ABX9EKV2_9GAMM|nr:hypothetical protein AU488_08785 [Lonsdalea populi]RAT31422.1 hypothetical protein AU492_15235 [Lonsdalea populi]RAT64796.1 hypothetical protein AU503_13000 [Lonsdalea populi]
MVLNLKIPSILKIKKDSIHKVIITRKKINVIAPYKCKKIILALIKGKTTDKGKKTFVVFL